MREASGIAEVKRRDTLVALVVAGTIAALHAIATWGHTTVFWGDYGYMMDLITRAHDGLVPYRDFHWPYPPLSIWIYGGATRLTGVDLAGVWAVTSIVYGSIVAAFVWYVRLVTPPKLQGLIAGVTVLLAVAIANLGSAPLPLGSYSPAGPLGFLFILVSWCATLTFMQRSAIGYAVLASAAAGLAVLTKHDYWIAAAYSVAVVGWHALPRRNHWGSWKLVAASITPAVCVVLAGSAVIAAQTDATMVFDIVRGFGLVGQQANRGAATLEILTIEIVILAGLVAVVSGAVQWARPPAQRRWRVPTLALAVCCAGLLLWLGKAYSVGTAVAAGQLSGDNTQIESGFANIPWNVRAFLRFSFNSLVERGFRHVIPFLLPFAVAVTLLVRGTRQGFSRDHNGWLLLLIGFALSLRARRQFEFTEWFTVLIEIPVYAALLTAWIAEVPARRVAVLATCALYAFVGMYAYHELARGALTARGTQPTIETPRGSYRAAPIAGALFRTIKSTVDSLDPSGRRPLFGYGYTNGYNYFTKRPYPSATPIGFRATSRSSPDSTVNAVLASQPPAIVIDNPFYDVSMYPKPGLHVFRWSLPFEHPPHNARMRAEFQRIVAACKLFRRLGDGPNAFAIYDCARPDSLSAMRSR